MKKKWKNIKCEGCALYPLPCIPTLWCFNSSLPGQKGRHFADDIFRCIFVNEKFCILIKILLKFVSVGPIDNNPSLVETMVLVQNRQLAFIWTHADPIHWRIYAALGVWMGVWGWCKFTASLVQFGAWFTLPLSDLWHVKYQFKIRLHHWRRNHL